MAVRPARNQPRHCDGMTHGHDSGRLATLDPDGLDPALAALYREITSGPRAADRERSPTTDRHGSL